MNAGKCQRLNCHGDLFIVSDIDGWHKECLLCSHETPMRNEEIVRLGLSPRRLNDVAPYTQSPSECRCTAFNTTPVFAHSKLGFKP